MSDKLKDMVKVGETFFFASDDNRINGRWKKTMKVVKVSNKFFEVEDDNGNTYKAGLRVGDAVRPAYLVISAGASVFGYKDENSYEFSVKKAKNIAKISSPIFWNMLSEEKLLKVFEALKEELE